MVNLARGDAREGSFDCAADGFAPLNPVLVARPRLRNECGDDEHVGVALAFKQRDPLFIGLAHFVSPAVVACSRIAELPGAGNGARQGGFA